jgi:hypothetical protein
LPQVRFSDEKRFCLWNDGPITVWRKAHQKYTQGFTKETKVNRRSIMVWLCIAKNGTSKLLRCPDRMDSNGYITQILTPALSFIRQGPRKRDPPVLFQQDGASCHTAKATEAFLTKRKVQVLRDWPAQSPDLNLVETCWSMVAHKLLGQRFNTADDLWAGIQAAWATVPPDQVTKLYDSMVRRLTAVMVAKGGNTKY